VKSQKTRATEKPPNTYPQNYFPVGDSSTRKCPSQQQNYGFGEVKAVIFWKFALSH